jgi:hypothetical protein
MRRATMMVMAAALGLSVVGGAVPASAAGQAPTVSGRVENSDSTPAEGAKVTVYADPQQNGRLPVGAETAMVEVGSGVADSTGRYAIRVDPATVKKFADAGGLATFNVSVLNDGEFQSGPAQLRVGSSTSARGATKQGGDSRGEAIGQADFDFGNTKLTRKAVKRSAANGASAASDRAASAADVSVKEDYGPRYVFFGQFISLVPDVKHRIDYTVGSETSLGWAVSSSGDEGSFSAGGTQIKSSDRTVYGETTGKVVDQYRTQYVYQKRFYQTCTAGWVCDSEYRIEPVSYAGGFDTYTEGSVPWPKKCVHQEAGSGFITTDSEGYTFDYGVSIAGMTDVQLSAKTDFSETVKQEVNYPTGGWTCGLDDYPGGKAPHVISADTINRGASTSASVDDTISLARAKSLSR